VQKIEEHLVKKMMMIGLIVCMGSYTGYIACMELEQDDLWKEMRKDLETVLTKAQKHDAAQRNVKRFRSKNDND
jgi:hypothetical protein